MKKSAGTLLALTLFCAAARAEQVADKRVLTLEGAKAAAAAAESDAKRRGLPVVIVVVDDAGNLLLLERLDTTQVGSIRVGIGKARTAAHFRRPTRYFEEQVRNGRIVTLALEDFTPLQGGVPIFWGGQFVGAIGVSGDSPQVDEEIALAGASVVR